MVRLAFYFPFPRIGLAARLAATLTLWRARARQRRHLARLDDLLLKDIGVSRCDAEAEATKPFWQP